MMTIGGGIGIKVVLDGKVVNPNAEIGHMKINPSPFTAVCGCGDKGCVEAEAGGRAVTRKVIATCEALGIAIPEAMHPCAFLDEILVEGKGGRKSWAWRLYNDVSRSLGILLANLQLNYGVPLLIIKGTFALKAFPLIRDQVLTHMRANLSINPDSANIRIEESKDSETGAMIGVAELWEDKYGEV